jgi:HSP20 family molecular chaperone IbpA
MATSKPAPSGKLPSATPQIIRESEKEFLNQAIHRRISERAYHLYESSGHEHGNHHAQWLQAESEILQRGLEARESGSWLSLNASLPDVSGADVQIYLEPKRVIVRAEKSDAARNTDSQTQGLTQRELVLVADLNVEIEPSTASASFKDQKLTVMVKKRHPANAADPQAARTGS